MDQSIIKHFLLLAFQCIAWSTGAQLITHKSGQYELRDPISGDLLFEKKFDTIYPLNLRPKSIYTSKNEQLLPIFACVKQQQIQLFNSYTNQFYPGTFDEIKLYRQIDEQSYGVNPPKYIPYWVDCFMLRKGDLWGYLSYKKEYSFHDKLEKRDSFIVIEPQYQELKFVEEEHGYDSQKYRRKKRIVAARKDAFWGALSFETGEVVVPFIYTLPIFSMYSSYDNRGIEFLSTSGGFILYYLARKTWDSIPQVVINPKYPNISFTVDFVPKVSIYQEFGHSFLYLEPRDDKKGSFKLYDYQTGKQLLQYERDSNYTYFKTLRNIENVLIIQEATPYQKLFRTVWFNLSTGKELLFAEGNSFKKNDFKLDKNDSLGVFRGKKQVGKLGGTGPEMHIEWTAKKQYIRK